MINMMKRLRRLSSDGLERANRKLAEEDGTITVEFIIVLPLLVAWFLGSLTFFEAYQSKSRTDKVTFALADVLSRYGTGPDAGNITEADLEEIYDIQRRMLPRRVSRGWLRVSSICYRKSGAPGEELNTYVPTQDNYRVLWSWVGDQGVPAVDGDGNIIDQRRDELFNNEVPLDLMPVMADGRTVIFVELFSEWRPISTLDGIVKPLTFWNKVAQEPRIRPTGIPMHPDHMNILCTETAGQNRTGA